MVRATAAGRYQRQPHLKLLGPLRIAGLDRPELRERPLLGVLRQIASTALLHAGRDRRVLLRAAAISRLPASEARENTGRGAKTPDGC